MSTDGIPLIFSGGRHMDSLLITADRLFDGTGAAAVLRPLVRIAAGRIQSVDGMLLSPATCSGQRFDFPGCTILPGLIDTHVHLVFSALETNEAVIEQVERESDAQLLARAQKNAQAALRVGLTTLRDCGGKGRIVQQLRDMIRRGDVEGPDILSCGMPITTTTGHCHWLGLRADTPEEVRRAAERMVAEDVDFLKVMATGGNMTPSSNPMKAQYDDDTLKMIADIGRAAGKHTAAHVLSRSALPGAVHARVRTIEHCDWRVQENHYEFDPALADRMIAQEQYVGLTMSGIARRSLLPEVNRLNLAVVQRLDKRFACERQMIAHGLRYTLHSDAGVRLTPIERFDLGLQAAAIELRLAPADVLRACTGAAAEALGLTDRGVVAAAKRADLVVVEGNPFEDLTCMSRVRAVLKSGRCVAR
jgi:imidazolonepropionase-like amidohydrolase